MKTYSELFGRPPDFRVRYRCLGKEGPKKPKRFYQHIRSPFSYKEFDEESEASTLFDIFPEFEAEDGSIYPEESLIPLIGTARMWINRDEMRDYHRERIKVGVKGFMGGGIKLAEVEVIEVVSLASE
ncbi:MAG: hypothetical protein PVF83_03245 [Anaerolineales bacterium]|jgi:hypothetical protein